jgi:LysM repeat protein
MADDTSPIIHSDSPVNNAVEIADGNNNWVEDAATETQKDADLAAGIAYHNQALDDTAAAQSLTSEFNGINGKTSADLKKEEAIISQRQTDWDASYGSQAEAVAYGQAGNAYVAPTPTPTPVAATPAPTPTPTPVAATPAPTPTPTPDPTTTGAPTPTPTPDPTTTGAPTPTPTPDPTTTGAPTTPTTTTTTTDPTPSAGGSNDPTNNDEVTNTSAGSNTGSSYEVVHGDTMSGIAEAHGVSLSSLEAANASNIPNPELIRPGEVVNIPGGGSASADSSTAVPNASTYEVQSGDTLSQIAANHGVSLAAVEAANASNIPNPELIRPGEVVNIPGGGYNGVNDSTDPVNNVITNSTHTNTNPLEIK